MKTKIIYIAGGGTGGHIYPGVAIARALQKIDPELQVRFVGTASGLETKIIPREGFSLDLIHGGKLNFSGHFSEKIKTLFKLPLGAIQALGLIIRHRPKFVLGVGGYASGPFVLTASLMGVPTAIWEPNAHPGMANRWLSRVVDRCYVVFAKTAGQLKNRNILQFGMPVRQEIENAVINPREDKNFHLLSFGGSQGSRILSQTLYQALKDRGEWIRDLKVVHQIGDTDFKTFQDNYKAFDDLVQAFDFIYDMQNYYAWADLVFVRGGASTIMELAAFGVVPIIVPLPAADDHQQKNAETLVQADAGVMILQKDLTPELLISQIQSLRANPERLKKMSKNLRTLFQSQASQKIAEDIITMIRKNLSPA